ncbi:hypothetical protein D3C73_1573390 [compost metagenome]
MDSVDPKATQRCFTGCKLVLEETVPAKLLFLGVSHYDLREDMRVRGVIANCDCN